MVNSSVLPFSLNKQLFHTRKEKLTTEQLHNRELIKHLKKSGVVIENNYAYLQEFLVATAKSLLVYRNMRPIFPRKPIPKKIKKLIKRCWV